jgi:hypothetical protein
MHPQESTCPTAILPPSINMTGRETGKTAKNAVSWSAKPGLELRVQLRAQLPVQLPVGRFLKKGRYAQHIGAGALCALLP